MNCKRQTIKRPGPEASLLIWWPGTYRQQYWVLSHLLLWLHVILMTPWCSNFNNTGGEGELFLCQDPFCSGESPTHEDMKYFSPFTEVVSFSMKISVRPESKTVFLAVVTSADWKRKQELNPRLLPSKWVLKPSRCYRDKSVSTGKKGNCEYVPNPDTVRSRWMFSSQ